MTIFLFRSYELTALPSHYFNKIDIDIVFVLLCPNWIAVVVLSSPYGFRSTNSKLFYIPKPHPFRLKDMVHLSSKAILRCLYWDWFVHVPQLTKSISVAVCIEYTGNGNTVITGLVFIMVRIVGSAAPTHPQQSYVPVAFPAFVTCRISRHIL